MKKPDVRIRISADQVRKLEESQAGIRNAAADLRRLADQPCPGFAGKPRLHVTYLQVELRKRAEWWDGFNELEQVIAACLADLNKRKKETNDGEAK